ncbi:hypothetical protein EWB00_010622 [Schistosoma japonicum]|uniref:Uncharacterized protein n=1 Tax=Schistosoma japonicum TaxID=6182 RepID=A0A4Z2DMW8_SCHJA|nr:hypothetical protein EWB00_010622 [Schistosoma japonicum]
MLAKCQIGVIPKPSGNNYEKRHEVSRLKNVVGLRLPTSPSCELVMNTATHCIVLQTLEGRSYEYPASLTLSPKRLGFFFASVYV